MKMIRQVKLEGHFSCNNINQNRNSNKGLGFDNYGKAS